MQAETEVIPSELESFKWLLEALCDELVEVHGDPANEDASWIRVVTDSRIVRAGDVLSRSLESAPTGTAIFYRLPSQAHSAWWSNT